MNALTYEPQAPAAIRHDGWTGEAIAKFLETLADTGIVLDACDAAGKSSPGAYALRRRDPLFAEAWEAALSAARDRLADTLLARSIEGNVEQIFKDGEIVAEKHVLDNRLGLAVLKRLDQRADLVKAPPQSSPSPAPKKLRWSVALTALRTGEADDVAAALAMFKGDEVSEVNDPPIPDGPCKLCCDDFEMPEESVPEPNCWIQDGTWWTDFPPPDGFSGTEVGEWNSRDYHRQCTGEEAALLEAEKQLRHRENLSEASASRDRWFAELREDLAEGGEPPLVD